MPLKKPILEEKKNNFPIEYIQKIFQRIIIVIFLIILISNCFYTIDAGERGILVTFGKPSETISNPGLHLKIPIIQHVVRMNIRTQTISFDNKQGQGDISEYSSLFSASKDLQDVQVAVVVNYHINEKDVLYIYKQYGTSDSFQKNILEPIVRETVKSAAARYTAEELVTKRIQFSDDVSKLLQESLESKQAVFDRFNVVNFQFSESFTQAIEAKVTAEQNALRSKNQLEQVKYEAEQRIAQAKGEAEAIKIQAEAIQSQGGKAYVQLRAIDKWDGKLPIYMGQGPVPFVDINSINA